MVYKKKNFWEYLFLISIFIFFFLPCLDTDLGWHLRYGQHFWQTGRFLTTNQISLLMPGYLWPNSYGLYQVIVWLVYHLAGQWGLTVLSSLVFGLVFWFCLKTSRSILVSLLAFLLIVFFGWGVVRFGIRAQIFSLLGISFCFWVIKDWSKRWLFLLPVFMFWANLHGAFVLGLVIIFLFSLFELDVKKFIQSGWAGLATLINPYGLKIYQEGWRHIFGVKLDQLIAEWAPPGFWGRSLVIASLAISLAVFLKVKKTSLVKTWLVFVLTAGLMSWQARRNLAILGLATALGGSFFNKVKKPNQNLNSLTQAGVILLLSFGLVFWLGKNIKFLADQTSWCKNQTTNYPCRAADWLAEKRLAGNIFNMYRWGGFLAWELPESKIFVDGRMPAWPHSSGQSPYTIFLKILQAQPDWNQKLKNHQIDYIFIPPGTFLDLELSATKSADKQDWPSDLEDWQEIYRDQKAVIYESI